MYKRVCGPSVEAFLARIWGHCGWICIVWFPLLLHFLFPFRFVSLRLLTVKLGEFASYRGLVDGFFFFFFFLVAASIIRGKLYIDVYTPYSIFWGLLLLIEVVIVC